MSLFTLVQSLADLPRACDELSDFLALRRKRGTPPLREALLGIWVEAHWVANLPCVLEWRESLAVHQTARVRETAGVSGIWMLCWLDVPAGARPLSRGALVESLLAAFERYRGDAPPPCFVPVFDAGALAGETQAEMRRLTAGYRELLLAPLYQNPITGRLETPAALPPRSERRH